MFKELIKNGGKSENNRNVKLYVGEGKITTFTEETEHNHLPPKDL